MEDGRKLVDKLVDKLVEFEMNSSESLERVGSGGWRQRRDVNEECELLRRVDVDIEQTAFIRKEKSEKGRKVEAM